MSCREYARSLINNLSLLSGLVLLPSSDQFDQICECLMELDLPFDDYHMLALINGTEELVLNSSFMKLKRIIATIRVKSPDP